MGGELGAVARVEPRRQLDWELLDDPAHAGVRRWVGDLNARYRAQPALHERDCDPAGFEWIDADDADQSVLAFLRHGDRRRAACWSSATSRRSPRHDYRVGVPRGGYWREVLNSDAEVYGGSGVGNMGGVEAGRYRCGRDWSLTLSLPPLGMLLLLARNPTPTAANGPPVAALTAQGDERRWLSSGHFSSSSTDRANNHKRRRSRSRSSRSAMRRPSERVGGQPRSQFSRCCNGSYAGSPT